MEDPSNKMEEIYALPPKLKYTESWLELKGKKGFVEYWTVLKGTYMFFFKDQNTHAKEQYVGYIGIEIQQAQCFSKKGSKTDFEIIMGKKKFQLRAKHDVLRDRWVYAINLVNKADPPGPLPGDLDFKEVADCTPAPDKMKKRAKTVCVGSIPIPMNSSAPDTNTEMASRDDLSLHSKSDSLPKPEEVNEEEEEQQVYDPVFMFPSWYYQKMSRYEAEELMFEQSPGSYLLRDSNKQKSLYALTIKDIGAMKHHRIWVNAASGECYFETASNVMLPNLLQAVDSLMKNTYHYLTAQPVCIEDRHSGDGEETIDMTEIPRRIIRSAPEDDYLSPGSLSPESPSGPFPYSSQLLRQTSDPICTKQKSQSLPVRSVTQRQRPAYENQDIIARPIFQGHQQSAFSYENQAILGSESYNSVPMKKNPSVANSSLTLERNFTSSSGESYIDMGSKFFEDRSISNDNDEEETPPALPVKKKSIQRAQQCDPIYENVPFVYLVRDGNHYDYPVTRPTPQSWKSTSWT